MTRVAALPLKFVLALLFAGSLLVQAVVPNLAAESGEHYPEVAHLTVGYSIAAIAAAAAFEVALVALWRLVTLAAKGQAFTASALTLVDVTRTATAVSIALTAAVLVHLLLIAQTGGPLWLAIAACLTGQVAILLLLGTARKLLAVAIENSRDLVGTI